LDTSVLLAASGSAKGASRLAAPGEFLIEQRAQGAL
jgi:hypothetical protein